MTDDMTEQEWLRSHPERADEQDVRRLIAHVERLEAREAALLTLVQNIEVYLDTLSNEPSLARVPRRVRDGLYGWRGSIANARAQGPPDG